MRNKIFTGVFLAGAVSATGISATPEAPGVMPVCETTEVMALSRMPSPSLPAPTAPTMLDREEYSPEGRFLLRWRSGGPAPHGAAVAEVARTLEAARYILVNRGGWVDPASGQPVEVHLTAGPAKSPSHLLLLEDADSGPEEGIATAMVVRGPPAEWPLLALHQYLHVLQLARSAQEDLWAYESAALALQDRLLGGGTLAPDLLARRQEQPQVSLFSERTEVRAGAAPFLVWLASTRGDEFFALWWQRAGMQWGENSIDALDTALRLRDLTPLEDAWRTYAVWSAYPDPALRPAMDAPGLAPLLPPTQAAARISQLPAGGRDDDRLMLEPMGHGVIRLRDLGDVGAVRLELESEAAARPAADVLVSWPHVDSGWLLVPVSFVHNRAQVTIPVTAGSDVAVVVRDRRRSGQALATTWQAQAIPSYPFELSYLAAEASAGIIDLTWGSASEEGLYGWLVYRSTSPRGPFQPMARFPFPALGEADRPLAYHFEDAAVTPGMLYYYLVEGITLDGLARRSPVVVRRALTDEPVITGETN